MNIYVILGIIALVATAYVWGRSKTWGDRIRFILIPISIVVNILFIYYIIAGWGYHISGDSLGNIQFKNIYHVCFAWNFIIEYLLISSIVMCITGWLKGGFSKLKRIKEKGLLAGLLWGLLWGFLVGFLGGLLVGLLRELLWGLLAGLLWGLLWGFLVGLLGGLSEEFSEKKKKTPKSK